MQEEKKSSFSFNWVRFLLIVSSVFFLFYVIKNAFLNPEEITLSFFKNELVLKQKVDRINIVDKQKVFVFLKKENDKSLLDKNYSRKILNEKQPEYFFEIGSVELFEIELNELQSNFPEKKKSLKFSAQQIITGRK